MDGAKEPLPFPVPASQREQGREARVCRQTERQQSKEPSVLPVLALRCWKPRFLLPVWGHCENRIRISTASTHEHRWQQLPSPKSDSGEGVESRPVPPRCAPTAGLSLCEDTKLEHLCPVSLPPTQTMLHQGGGGAALLVSGPRATPLPVPLPRSGNELQGTAAERCQNNFY